MSQTAYELTIEAGRLVAMLDACDGVADDEANARIAEFLENAADKYGGIVAVIRAAEADMVKLEAIASRYDAAITRKRSFIKQMRDNMGELLKAEAELTGTTKIKRPEFTAYLSNSKRLIVPDAPEAWPADFVTEKTTAKLDRAALKKAITGGAFVEGCAIVVETVFNLRK